MNIAEFALKQSRLAHVLFFILAAAGVAAWLRLPVDVYPDVTVAVCEVRTFVPGGTAEQIEREVTPKIEDAVRGVSQVDWIRSESTANSSRVIVHFRETATTAELDEAFAQVETRINQVGDLPDEARRPEARRIEARNIEFMRLAVRAADADANEHAADTAGLIRGAQRLKAALADVPGVGVTRLLGLPSREVRVHIDAARLEEHGLTLLEVIGILRESFAGGPLGPIEREGRQIPVHFQADLTDLATLRETIVRPDPTGASVTLEEVATLEEVRRSNMLLPRYRGEPCVLVTVAKQADANVLTVRAAVGEFLDAYRTERLGPGLRLEIADDRTPWVQDALTVMSQNLGVGCLLVLGVLWLFLGFRNALFAMLGIPFSFLCTILAMWLAGLTLNTASVFGLVLVSGLIVDDAIVVLENVHRHGQEGAGPRTAIVRGVNQVVPAVVAAALTTVVTFLPILLVPGTVAKVFADVPKVVALALAASLFECLIVLPSHIFEWGGRAGESDESELDEAEPPSAAASAEAGSPADVGSPAGRRPEERRETPGENPFAPALWERWLADGYGYLLAALLRLRYLAVLTVVALAALAFALSSRLPRELLPSDFPMAAVNFEIDHQASIEETDRIGRELSLLLEDIHGDDQPVKSILAIAGLRYTDGERQIRRPSVGLILVTFNPTDAGRRDPDQQLQILRETLERGLADRPDLQPRHFSVMPLGSGLEQTPDLTIRVEQEDLDALYRGANRIQRLLASHPGVAEANHDLQPGPLELQIDPQESTAKDYGLTAAAVRRLLFAATSGVEVAQLRASDGQDAIPVRAMLAPRDRDEPSDLLGLRIQSPTGAEPTVRQIADWGYERRLATLYRHDGRRAGLITGQFADAPVTRTGQPASERELIQELKAEIESLQQELPGLEVEFGGKLAEQSLAFNDLMFAGLIGGMLIYVILVALFRDYVQPFLVIFTLLFGAIGVVIGLAIHEIPLSVVTAVSVVGLFGVAVNDAIILIDFINQTVREEAEPLAAIVAGCRLRLRPIIVTTLTTVFGLLPMAIGVGGYSTIWSPFAATFCYGLGMATLLTLLATPCLYLILEDVKHLFGRLLLGFTPTQST